MMQKKILILCISFLFLLRINTNAQTIKLISFANLKAQIDTSTGVNVYNFWATWCRSCVEELPYFEKAGEIFSAKGVRMTLVNLDFNSKVERLAVPFVKSKKLKSKVVHFTDTDPNNWINQIDTSWSGAIPATVIFKNGKKVYFKEGEMNQAELETEIEKAMK